MTTITIKNTSASNSPIIGDGTLSPFINSGSQQQINNDLKNIERAVNAQATSTASIGGQLMDIGRSQLREAQAQTAAIRDLTRVLSSTGVGSNETIPRSFTQLTVGSFMRRPVGQSQLIGGQGQYELHVENIKLIEKQIGILKQIEQNTSCIPIMCRSIGSGMTIGSGAIPNEQSGGGGFAGGWFSRGRGGAPRTPPRTPSLGQRIRTGLSRGLEGIKRFGASRAGIGITTGAVGVGLMTYSPGTASNEEEFEQMLRYEWDPTTGKTRERSPQEIETLRKQYIDSGNNWGKVIKEPGPNIYTDTSKTTDTAKRVGYSINRNIQSPITGAGFPTFTPIGDKTFVIPQTEVKTFPYVEHGPSSIVANPIPPAIDTSKVPALPSASFTYPGIIDGNKSQSILEKTTETLDDLNSTLKKIDQLVPSVKPSVEVIPQKETGSNITSALGGAYASHLFDQMQKNGWLDQYGRPNESMPIDQRTLWEHNKDAFKSSGKLIRDDADLAIVNEIKSLRETMSQLIKEYQKEQPGSPEFEKKLEEVRKIGDKIDALELQRVSSSSGGITIDTAALSRDLSSGPHYASTGSMDGMVPAGSVPTSKSIPRATSVGIEAARSNLIQVLQDPNATEEQRIKAAEGISRANVLSAERSREETGTTTTSAMVSSGGVTESVVRKRNKGATRNQDITPELESRVHEAVRAVYGEGARADLYSGGQEEYQPGKKQRRTGSTRHDAGKAGDFYIYDAEGNQIKGDALGNIAQYWLAKGYGSVGLEMKGGGIHLDEHTDRATAWGYADKGGQYSKAQREAVRLGKSGQMPELKMNPFVAALPGQSIGDEKRSSVMVSSSGVGGIGLKSTITEPKNQEERASQFYSGLYNAFLSRGYGEDRAREYAKAAAAQVALESRWGSAESGKHNIYGIKAGKNEPGTVRTTKEYRPGRGMVTEEHKFRDYASPDEAALGYVEFIEKNPRYAKALQAQTTDEYIEQVAAAGYATDPNYASKVKGIAHGSRLARGIGMTTAGGAIAAMETKPSGSAIIEPSDSSQPRITEVAPTSTSASGSSMSYWGSDYSSRFFNPSEGINPRAMFGASPRIKADSVISSIGQLFSLEQKANTKPVIVNTPTTTSASTGSTGGSFISKYPSRNMEPSYLKYLQSLVGLTA